MIRDDAARKIAETLIGPFVSAGVATREMVETAASIIKNYAEADDLQQQIEATEARIAAAAKRDGAA